MELTGYLAVARRWWWTLLVATWVAGLAGLLVATRITPTYEAQAQMLVGPINTDSDTLKASGLLVQTYAQLAISSPLLKSTAQEIGDVDPTKLGQNVRATANDVTRVLTIRVQDSNAERAARIANTMSDELIQLTTGATTRPEGQLEVIGAAVPPTTPIAPQISLIVLLAMAAGLIGGLVLVIVVEYATDTIRDRSDLARLSGTEVLATIAFDARVPGVSPLPVAEAAAPGSPNAIAFRLLASKVAFSEHDAPTRTILVTGVGDGDSAVVAAGIAAAVAGSGHRALVIDGSPEGDITSALGLTGRLGLRDVVLREGIEPRAALVDGPAGMKVMPRGETGSAELIAVDRTREILDGLLSAVDLIVIDGGAMQRSAGALSWARAAQESILLVRRGASRRDDVRLAVESLRFVNASIGGSVLVQRSPGRGFRRNRARTRPAPPPASSVPPEVRSRLDQVGSSRLQQASRIEPASRAEPAPTPTLAQRLAAPATWDANPAVGTLATVAPPRPAPFANPDDLPIGTFGVEPAERQVVARTVRPTTARASTSARSRTAATDGAGGSGIAGSGAGSSAARSSADGSARFPADGSAGSSVPPSAAPAPAARQSAAKPRATPAKSRSAAVKPAVVTDVTDDAPLPVLTTARPRRAD